MNVNPHYFSKLKYIVIPFSIIAWGTVLFLGFLRWWLFLGKFPILELSEDLALLDSSHYSLGTDPALPKTTF